MDTPTPPYSKVLKYQPTGIEKIKTSPLLIFTRFHGDEFGLYLTHLSPVIVIFATSHKILVNKDLTVKRISATN